MIKRWSVSAIYLLAELVVPVGDVAGAAEEGAVGVVAPALDGADGTVGDFEVNALGISEGDLKTVIVGADIAVGDDAGSADGAGVVEVLGAESV